MTRDVVASLTGVSHRYGATAALSDLSLDIPSGCMAGLIGPDGVGKSTLLALVSGVRKLQDGGITVLGGDIAAPAHRRVCSRRIAYMPQGLGRNLYPTLSVYENLDFFGQLFGQSQAERHARIMTLLQATGLAPFPDRPAGKLSGGMKQKLSLCSALIHDPDLVILDEPTTGVDPLSRRQFWDLIAAIRKTRPDMSVLVSTAYMEEAERFDWLAAMNAGRIIATGSPDEIRARTGQPTLERAFIDLLPEAERRSHRSVEVPPRPDRDGPPAIEARGLTRRFGDFTAVDHVDFQIRPGEIFGFLGSNGCGKTTTMKMLTGLQTASEGQALLFGEPLDPDDMATRRRVGYMSQSFSLYSELSVRQNLDLHARLYHLPPDRRDERVAQMLQDFDLQPHADKLPDGLPLGIRQRLQLAVAVLHAPEVLILDEPTSGVDPVARDGFWQYLIRLSRDEGVTIFVSTHFMNEAERCDRISLMHAGRVLAVGAPSELVRRRGAATLEDAFVGYLQEAAGPDRASPVQPSEMPHRDGAASDRSFDPMRLWAFARREAIEILRDPLRLTFALLGPVILLLTFGYGISFDVEDLPFAVLDQDQSAESRTLTEAFSGSRYFVEQPPVATPTELATRLKSAQIVLGLDIPPDFGRSLLSGETPEIRVDIDGAMPFRAETVRGYLQGAGASYLAGLAAQGRIPAMSAAPVSVETRFRYNQAFKSVFAMIPSVIMLMLVLIPSMMSAIGVVREKETGSIANFRSTPASRTEFLLGKQLPYAAVAMISFVSLVAVSYVVFGVSIKGSVPALVVGSLLYVLATTGFGVLISTFTRTQIAATFAAAIVSIIPAINFSGLLVPVSSLSTGGQVAGRLFPSAWYEQISVGVFAKGLGFADLWPNHLVLAGFFVLFVTASILSLNKQET